MRRFFIKRIFLFLIGIMLCGTITAQTNYGIKIAGTDLTPENAGAINNSNFPNLGLTSGTITYNHSTKTFTLSGVNANITAINGGIIYITEFADNGNYKIILVDNNIITSVAASIWTYRNLTIEGSGSLKLKSDASGIYVLNTLTIKNTIVEARGKFGITGYDATSGEKLIIEKSIVKAKGDYNGSICDLQSITLIDCDIIQPEGAVVGNAESGGQAVMLNGEVVETEVVIGQKTGITTTETATAFNIYPNPVKATLYMESNAEVSRIEVYDVLGCRQLSTTCSNEIDCSTLSAGIYFLKLTTPQGNLIKKFVKE